MRRRRSGSESSKRSGRGLRMGIPGLGGQRGSRDKSKTPTGKARYEIGTARPKGTDQISEAFNETFKFQPLAGGPRRPRQATALHHEYPTEKRPPLQPSTGVDTLSRETSGGDGEHLTEEESPASFLRPGLFYEAESPAPTRHDDRDPDSPATFLTPSLLYEAERSAPSSPSGWRGEAQEANESLAVQAQTHAHPEGSLDAEALSVAGEQGQWRDQTHALRVPKVLVIDREGQLSEALAKAAADFEPAPEVLRLNRSTQLVEVVADEQPDVIVVAPEDVTGAGLKRLAEVHRADPRVVILLSDNGKPLSVSQIAACGASDILTPHPTKARLRSKLANALDTAEELRKEHVVVTERVVMREPEVPAPVPAPAAPAAEQTRVARILTVASASGGSGKTFYSSNLAAYLAKATGGRVLLIDLDLQFGEIAISLRLRPPQTIAELVEEEDLPAALPDYLVDHRCGFKVLCAPKDPMTGERIGSEQITAVLHAARKQFDYIVVDTPPTLNDTCLAAFDESDSLLIMANMDLASLKNLHVFLETLEKLNMKAERVFLIVNKAESGTGLDLEEVEPIFPQGFTAVLPYAKEVSRSINTGVPVLEGEPKADISRKLAEGFMKLVPASPGVTLPWAAQPQPLRRRPLSRLLKGKAR
jgi:pilus assembly protein CpaE